MKYRFTIAVFKDDSTHAMNSLKKIIKRHFDKQAFEKIQIEHSGLKSFEEAGCYHHEIDVTGNPESIELLKDILD